MILTLTSFGHSGQFLGHDVGIRLVRSNGEIVQELVARNEAGEFRDILLSPTHPSIKSRLEIPHEATAIGLPASSLYNRLPTFLFSEATIDEHTGTVTLKGDSQSAQVTETVKIPATGKLIEVKLHVHLKSPTPVLEHLLATYAFAPGTPDTTWAPGLRKKADQVIGDHFFRSPAVVAQKAGLSAAILPDLDILAANRPIPTIVDLNCKPEVCDQPLLSYGFCDYHLVSHVAYAHDASMSRPVPQDLNLGFQIYLDGKTAPSSAYQPVASLMWQQYGHRYIDKILPQAVPFADYAKYCYPNSFKEKETGGWFEKTIDGQVCGGLPSGWGLDQGWVSWQAWFNQLRSAWGIRWWGKKLGNSEWVDKSGKMLNLALAAPSKEGACPTTFESKTATWHGSLISPQPECYYDLTNIAWKGIQFLRWLKEPDCPRRDAVKAQADAIADLLVAKQSDDGSWPSWLDKNLKPVPMLDRSAQSALPAWFLGEWAVANSSAATRPAKLKATLRGADFLAKEVVDQQRYYDFETFFSCSPKECLQRGGKIDDPAMMDPYTLQRPQNTLSMQWTAEALRVAHHLAPTNDRYMVQSMKALDMMCLYQEVWPISYIKTAYVYGGFGVQNSDGEYNDARQAQFAETLCSFGAELDRQDLFERGVAAARATLTLINHPLHQSLGIYPNPNYPPGLEPENCGHGGTDEQDGRSGFDWAEGSGLTTMAGLLEQYGPEYHSPKGWTVKIDGVAPGEHVTLPTVAPLENPTFDFADGTAPGWTFAGDFLAWPLRSTRMSFNNGGLPFIGTAEDGKGGFEDAYTGTITSPEFTTTRSKLRLLVGGGSGDGEYVELIDASGKRLYVEHGHDTEQMDERVWDLRPYQGQRLRIRIVDQDKGGWGHVNVGNIHLSN